MGIFEHFPYTNFHEMNLDWMLNELKKLESTIEDFVSINALKYADPIQWNIVSQYEKNTIVIDPLTGTAYISVLPVPSGVAITNTDYWTVVFDLGSFVVRAAKNFTDKFEEDTTLTATFPSSVNDWIIWGDVLYRVISPIVAGDQYVIGSNIVHFTAEDVIGHLEDLTTTDKTNLVAAINEVAAAVLGKIGDLANLGTVDKSTIVNAINEVLADTNWIRFRISPYTEVGNPATVAVPINTLFWLNNQTLCESMTAISIGDTLIDGTNYYPVSLQSLFANILNINNLTAAGSILTGGNINVGGNESITGDLTIGGNESITGDLTIGGKINSPLTIGTIPDVEGLLHRLYDETNVSTASNILTVGAHGCNFTTINDAITAARDYCTPSNRVLIWIMPGVYNEQIKLIPNPGIDFIGYGAKLEGAYNYPEAPLYMIGKCFVAGIEFWNAADPNDTHSYAFHCDAQDLINQSDAAGYMRFIDCWFISRSHAGIGIGLGSGEYIVFENCWINNSENNNLPGAYMHNYPAGDANYSYIKFKNCEITATSNTADVQIYDEGGYNNHNVPFSIQFVECNTKNRQAVYGKGLNGTHYTNAHDLASNAPNFMYYPETDINPYGGTPFAYLDSSKFALNSVAPTINAGGYDTLYIDTPFDAQKYTYTVGLFELEPIISDPTDPDYVVPSFGSYTLSAITSRTIQIVFTGLINTRAVHYNINAVIN